MMGSDDEIEVPGLFFEVEGDDQSPVEPRPERSDIPPIDQVKLLILLDRLAAHYRSDMERFEGISEKEAAWNTGAFTVLFDLKQGIVERHHDLEAETT